VVLVTQSVELVEPGVVGLRELGSGRVVCFESSSPPAMLD